MCSVRVAADDLVVVHALQDGGFHYQELALTPWLDLSRWEPRGYRVTRRVTAGDIPELCRISRAAFRTDRFHTDPRFDGNAANGVYERWIRTWHGQTGGETVDLVLVHEDRVAGFFLSRLFTPHATAGRRIAALVLGGVDPALSGKGLGTRMYCDMMDAVQQRADYASVTIAVRNSAVLNLYNKLGFRISSAGEVTLHRWLD
jgi:ribosomal protein S18 acetylase RimI-like enzyme